MADQPYVFYPALVAVASSRWRLRSGPGVSPAAWEPRRGRSSCSRSPCPSPTRSTGLRPACRSSARWPRRPIPIAPRARIRRPSPCGGSTISTNGSATTACAARSRSRTRKRSFPSCWSRAAAAGCSTRRSGSTPLGFRGPEIAPDEGRPVPHRRARRVADLRPDPARRRKAMAGASAGPVRPARVVRPDGRGRQRGNRSLYARGQSRAACRATSCR